MPNWAKYTLLASMFVVIVIAAIVYAMMVFKARKIRREVLLEENQKALQTLEKYKIKEIKILPLDLKNMLKSKITNEDLKHLITTCFVNDAHDVLVIGENNEYLLANLINITKFNFYANKTDFNVKLWNQAVSKYPDFFTKSPNFTYDNALKFDLIYVLSSKSSNFDLYKSYYPLLKDNKMLVIVQNNETNQDLKSLSKDLKRDKINYEISYVKAKYLYIVKKSELN